MTPGWTSFFGLEECLDVRLYHEGCLCAIAEVTEGELTPLPWLGHHEDLAAALHPMTRFFMHFEYVLTLHLTQPLLTPEEVLPLCCYDVGDERGVVHYPGIMSTACFLVGAICPTRLPVETVDVLGVSLVELKIGVRDFHSSSQKGSRLRHKISLSSIAWICS